MDCFHNESPLYWMDEVINFITYNHLLVSYTNSPTNPKIFGDFAVLGGSKGCEAKRLTLPRFTQVEEFLALSFEEQKMLLKRLTHHALCKMRLLTWRGAYLRRGGSVPGGYEADDFALDAIGQLIDGTRNWNREKYPTLESVLRSFIDSIISKIPTTGEATFDLIGNEPTPLQIAVNRDWEEHLHNAAIAELNGDQFLEQLLECLVADITAPSEIAQLLCVEVVDVHNGKKRLQRRLENLDRKFSPKRAKQ